MSNPGSKYVRLLADTKGQRLNNGTVAGGLAHALTQGMRGYAARKADEEEKQKAEQREQAMADTLAAMNGPALTSEGPTQDAASRARFEAPGRDCADAERPADARLRHDGGQSRAGPAARAQDHGGR